MDLFGAPFMLPAVQYFAWASVCRVVLHQSVASGMACKHSVDMLVSLSTRASAKLTEGTIEATKDR